MADWCADKENVDVFTEAGTVLGEFGVALLSSQTGDSTVAELLLLLLVVTAAPFKVFTREATLLRRAERRFLGDTDPVEASLGLGEALWPRFPAVLMLTVDVKVDTADSVCVVMDAPCDSGLQLVSFTEAGGGEEISPKHCVPSEAGAMVLTGLALLELTSFRISGLLQRPCCCCSSVVVPPGAGSVFPK